MASAHEDHHCVRCGHRGALRRPHPLAKPALVGVYVSLAAMLVGAALSGLGVVALGPLAIALCTFIQAPLSTAAATPPRCASCGVYVEPEAPAEARPAPRGVYPVRA